MTSVNYSLLKDKAIRLTKHGFLVLPLHNKIPVIKYKGRREQIATQEELDLWFNGNPVNDKDVNGIAIAINKTEFAIDTDGAYENTFLNIVGELSSELQEKIHKTMYTKTPHGNHRTFRLNPEDFPDGIKEKKIISDNGHNEILIHGRDHILVERGDGYDVVNDVESIVILSKAEVNELCERLNGFRDETNAIMEVAEILKPFYRQPHRDNIIFSFAGYMHKNKATQNITEKIAIRLASITNYYDEDINKSLKVIEDKYTRNRDSEEVSGYQLFSSTLLDAAPEGKSSKSEINKAINKIQLALWKAHLIDPPKSNNGSRSGSEVDDNGLPDTVINEEYVMAELKNHTYYSCIRRSKPVRIVLAHDKDKQIVNSIIDYKKETYNEDGKDRVISVGYLKITDNVINAIPTRVIINMNPLTKVKEYKITFESKASKRPIVVGPCQSVEAVVDELSLQNLIIKQLSALDCLRSILYRYEIMGHAEITEEVGAPGFYLIDGQIKGYSIFQKDFDPMNIQKINQCIDVMEKLHDVYYAPKGHSAKLATTLVWSAVAPFSFIKKYYNSSNMEYALRWPYSYGWPDTGKTTKSLITFGMWNIHKPDIIERFKKVYTSVNSEARLGNTVSSTTYPVMVDEVNDALGDWRNSTVMHSMKGCTVNLICREVATHGKGPRTKYYALAPLMLIGNPPPPIEDAFRKRIIPDEYFETDQIKNQDDINAFEKWFIEEDNITKLSVFGDFVWYYVQNHREGADFILKHKWQDIAHELYREFYRLASRQIPKWLDSHIIKSSQRVMQENVENVKYQVIAFLHDIINDTYSKWFKKDDTNIMAETLRDRLTFCLRYDLIPFIRLLDKRRIQNLDQAITRVAIRQDFVYAMSKWTNRATNTNHISLTDLTAYMEGFEIKRVKHGTERAIVGTYQGLMTFLNNEIKIADNENYT